MKYEWAKDFKPLKDHEESLARLGALHYRVSLKRLGRSKARKWSACLLLKDEDTGVFNRVRNLGYYSGTYSNLRRRAMEQGVMDVVEVDKQPKVKER